MTHLLHNITSRQQSWQYSLSLLTKSKIHFDLKRGLKLPLLEQH